LQGGSQLGEISEDALHGKERGGEGDIVVRFLADLMLIQGAGISNICGVPTALPNSLRKSLAY